MKQSFLSGFAALVILFTSCSDDNNAPENTSGLTRIETILGPSNAVLSGQTTILKRVQHYEQGAIVADTVFDMAGNYHFYTLRTSAGNTHTETTYTANGTVSATYTKTYDSNNRIIKTEHTTPLDYLKYTISYTNSGNITVNIVNTIGEVPSPTLYSVNQDGLIDTMSFGNQTFHLTYINGKPVAKTHTSDGFVSTINYTYYSPATPAPLLSVTEMNNKILEIGIDSVVEIIPEFKGVSNGVYYDKTFDSQGRITRSKFVINGNYPDVTYYYN